MADLKPLPLCAQNEYQRLVEEMPVMLWTADVHGIWTHVNRRWTEYTGLLHESKGFGFEEALHPDDVQPTLAVWRAAVASDQHYDVEYRLRDQSGCYRWFVTRGRRLPDGTHPDLAWVGSCSDIDEQKRAERAAQVARQSAVRALGLALEVRDRETAGHTDRVTALAQQLGRILALPEELLTELETGALLHDIGKIGVSDAVLFKPGPLSEGERAQINRHAQEGERFAAALGFVSDAALSLIRHHHEHWDGSGYPDGLAGEAIPRLARLFAVVDSYDAMISVRPYKDAWSRAQALAELERLSGQTYDPEMVAALTTWLRAAASD
ncbi:HD domain-containing phosphohydrolase [Deinococcus alpinitundrae]|uniref:HD domain-containing phosphohydrolase n=1 Tax=Deinococcus alpinitundrae TaxID=468913 RepID=UPI001379F63B|nr:HD domain-containing phosphohydrolase [Deinococcus alpinitundrae]